MRSESEWARRSVYSRLRDTQHLMGDHRRRALGAIQAAGAGVGVVAFFAPAVLSVAVAFFGTVAVGFIARPEFLWRTDREESCECTPFSTSVTCSHSYRQAHGSQLE